MILVLFVDVTSHTKNFLSQFMVFKFPLLQPINKYTSVAFTQVVRSPVWLSDVRCKVKFRTLNQWRTQEFFFGGGSTNSIEDRGQRTGIWGR
jgi:hypothetical protein